MKLIVAIVGPTGSGKTRLAHLFARRHPVGIIAADSRTVYRGMDIGTAKPSLQEREGIPYYGLDLVEPGEEFSVFAFKKLAEKAIQELEKKQRLPLIVGGTGLYLRALLDDLSLAEVPPQEELRKQLQAMAQEKGTLYLHGYLKQVDPESAGKIHPHDEKRIVRALEIFLTTGKPKSFYQRKEPSELRKQTMVFGLHLRREVLYERINRRVEAMFRNGLLGEARKLLSGNFQETRAAEAIGYREALGVLRGELSMEEAIWKTQKRTRHYAKKQITWFRKEPDIYWHDATDEEPTETVEALEKAYQAFCLLKKEFASTKMHGS